MIDLKQDIYNTQQSSISSIDNIGQQLKLDLSLKLSTNDINGGLIKGTIKDASGNPVNNAYIKLLSITSEPLRHTISNNDGSYILTSIPQGTYNVMVIGTGYKLMEQKNILIEDGKENIMNFNLEQDPAQSNGIIVGKLLNFSNRQAVEGGVIFLYKIDINNEKTIQAIIYSNEYGEFCFRNIPKGNYTILVNTLGYISKNIDVSITITGQISYMDIYIIPNPATSRGTVSGVILNKSTNAPVQRAEVILYKVKEDNSLMPMAFTKTNQNGVYLFINVPGGNYKIKSNALEIVDINVQDTIYKAPDFKSFEIQTLGAFTPNIFYAKNGILENGARINSVTDYVTNLGGDNNGQVIVSLPAIDGPYELGFQYLASSNKQYLKLSINEEIINLQLPTTDNMNPTSSKYYSLTINLHAGMNDIKFFNDGGNLAPDINEVTLKMLPYAKDYLAKDGELYSGATVSPQTGYVTNLGPNDAYLKFNIFAPIGGKYEIQIQYLSGDRDRSMSILITDIFDSNKKQTLVFPKTNSFNVNDAKFLTTTFTLIGGDNEIYFYNDNLELCPEINIIRVKEVFLDENFNVSDVQLFNGAGIQNGLITDIVSGLGYLILTANISGSYSYNLVIEYVSNENTNICYIDINDIPTGESYLFEPSGNTPKKKIIPLLLEAGENKIKIYNPSKTS